jgi:predicted site-specific integrase-resolvase
MNSPDPEPMMSLDKFMEQTGLSSTTLWRWRKKGMLTTVNICGRQYVLRSEIGRFNERAAAGEFARTLGRPKKRAIVADQNSDR